MTNVAVDTKQYPTGQNNPVINMHLSLFLHFSEDFGRTFKNITSLLSKDEPIFIRKHVGIFRHPHDKKKVNCMRMLIGYTLLKSPDQRSMWAFAITWHLLSVVH